MLPMVHAMPFINPAGRAPCVQTRGASLSSHRVLIRGPSPPLPARAEARAGNGGEGVRVTGFRKRSLLSNNIFIYQANMVATCH